MCQTKLSQAVSLLVLLLWAAGCRAERADRNAAMHLEADQVVMDDLRQVSTFTGNVKLSQGTLLIRGDKVIVSSDKGDIKHATVYGDTAEFRQKRDGVDEYVEGYGERIDYDMGTQILDFSGKARLKRNRDEVSGDHISYNARTEVFQVNGKSTSAGSTHQRVRAILQPKSRQSGDRSSDSAAPCASCPAQPVSPHK